MVVKDFGSYHTNHGKRYRELSKEYVELLVNLRSMKPGSTINYFWSTGRTLYSTKQGLAREANNLYMTIAVEPISATQVCVKYVADLSPCIIKEKLS